MPPPRRSRQLSVRRRWRSPSRRGVWSRLTPAVPRRRGTSCPLSPGADGLEDQSDAREIGAYQKWLQGGASSRSRAAHFRAAAEALLASGNDAETKAIAKAMTKQATAEDRNGTRPENESESLLRKKATIEKRADATTARAVELEASAP